MPAQPGLTLRELREKPITTLRAVGDRLAGQLGELALEAGADGAQRADRLAAQLPQGQARPLGHAATRRR